MVFVASYQTHGTADSRQQTERQQQRLLRQPDIVPLEEKEKQCYWSTKIQFKNTENERNSSLIPVIVYTVFVEVLPLLHSNDALSLQPLMKGAS